MTGEYQQHSSGDGRIMDESTNREAFLRLSYTGSAEKLQAAGALAINKARKFTASLVRMLCACPTRCGRNCHYQSVYYTKIKQ